MSTSGINLPALAHKVMLDLGFEPDLPPDARRELDAIQPQKPSAGSEIRDLRSLLWSSIDNDDSRDLDQIEVAEKLPDGSIRIYVGVADVDNRVPVSSALDHHAAVNTTSVYTGVATFPMLPERLSTDLTSLNEGQDRLAVVVEMVVEEDGEVHSRSIYRAWVRNQAKLAYDATGGWLEGTGPAPAPVANVPGLADQLKLQDEAAARLHQERIRSGALDFETIEAHPVMQDGKVVDLAVSRKTRARVLIENFMIAANVSMATTLEEKGLSSIQRIVRSPERWSRIVDLAARLGTRLPDEPDSLALAHFLSDRRKVDPDHFPDLSLAIVKLMGPGEYTVVGAQGTQAGHFGLAVHNYTHSTAPNRRYADVIIQRLIKAAFAGKPAPYSFDDLDGLARHCTEREDAARKAERTVRKIAAAVLMEGRIGEVFDAIVTGASRKGTFVRLLQPPVEGMVVRNADGMDVGEKVRVRLLSTEPARGFIDFEGV